MPSVMKIINTPLSDSDIRRILGNDINIVKYSELSQFNDINELLKNAELDYCIILLEEELDSGHWLCLSRYNNIYEVFDSLGVPVDSELKWINATKRRKLNEDTPYLSNLLQDKTNVIHNTVKYQEDEIGVNTCGSHVCHRLYCLKNYSMGLYKYHDYMKEIKKATGQTYDYIVADFIRFHL